MKSKICYSTNLGKFYIEDSVKLLNSELYHGLKNKIQLILTSPPFPLNNKKRFGNLEGEDYKKWFTNLSTIFSNIGITGKNQLIANI